MLRQALAENGFFVHYMGTQNRLEQFFEKAVLCDVVMISNMDGHARHYLREFPRLVGIYQARKPLWYLGGNLTIGDGAGHEEFYLALGFNRVFVKHVDVQRVLSVLRTDLNGVDPIGTSVLLKKGIRPHIAATAGLEGIGDELVQESEFHRQRKEVLDHWKTGSEAASLEGNAEYLAKQPTFAAVQRQAREGERRMLVQPRSGVANPKKQVELFQAFRASGADVLSYQVDSLTRNNNYAGVEEALFDKDISGESPINGFPVVNHGVNTLRKILALVGSPMQTRHSTRDPRLLAEISYAGGVTSYEGGSICYNMPYYKDYRLKESIEAWQYVDRLTGLYFKKFGIVLDREFFGTLTATLIPPSLAIVINVIEMLLAVQQGVRSVSLGYAEQGNRAQDIAAIRMLDVMSRRVLDNMSYGDVQVNTVFHQYMAAFPLDPVKAEELIYQSSVTAALSGATRIIVKTPVEALKIPAMSDNVHGINLTLRGLQNENAVRADERSVQQECEVIEREVDQMLASVLMCGKGSLARGVVRAFEQGYLDIPFSPSLYNKNGVVTVRDSQKAVRFLDVGNLQLDRDSIQFHREKIQERRRQEAMGAGNRDYLMIEKDVLEVCRGQYEHWPLFG